MQDINPGQDAAINRRLTLIRRDARTSSTRKETTPAAALNFIFGGSLPSILAGYTSGICGLLVGHPFDSLKVLLQAPLSNKVTTGLFSTSNKTVSIFQKFRSLYAGILPPMLTVGMIQSVNFFCYDALRRTMYNHFNEENNIGSLDYLYHDTIGNVMLSSAITASFLSIFTSPFQLLKTQQQLYPSWSLRYIFQQNFKKQASTKMLYVGYPSHLCCEVIGRATYLGSYEYIKRWFARRRGGRDLSLPDRMVCASAAGIFSWSVIYPMDVVRTNMYALQARKMTSSGSSNISNKEPSPSTRHMIQEMYKSGGIRAFFRGFTLTILRAGPVAAVVLPVYDISLLWFHEHIL